VLQRVRLLTKQELVIILLGLDILQSSIDPRREDLNDAISGLMNKIKKIVGNVATASPIVDSAHRAIITQAISSRLDLVVSYHSTIRDSISERVITPLELSLDHGFEVLDAYCQNAGGFRTFRLDNMKSVQLAGSSVSIPQAPESSDYQWQLMIKSRFRTSSERFRSTYRPRESSLEEKVTVNSFSQDWLLRNALSTLASVEVQLPVSARSQIAQKCQQTLELYENWPIPN
jgi:proteasome accessory factor C